MNLRVTCGTNKTLAEFKVQHTSFYHVPITSVHNHVTEQNISSLNALLMTVQQITYWNLVVIYINNTPYKHRYSFLFYKCTLYGITQRKCVENGSNISVKWKIYCDPSQDSILSPSTQDCNYGIRTRRNTFP